jgi:tetraacyldisaccharide 4'-kinase
MGGTGKSPVTIHLTSLLSDKLNVAILSRGYGRKTKGFRWVNQNSTNDEVGDETLMFKKVFVKKMRNILSTLKN